jgi:hypothetical protein
MDVVCRPSEKYNEEVFVNKFVSLLGVTFFVSVPPRPEAPQRSQELSY